MNQPECHGVYDSRCDALGSYYLCKRKSLWDRSTAGSCVYHKPTSSVISGTNSTRLPNCDFSSKEQGQCGWMDWTQGAGGLVQNKHGKCLQAYNRNSRVRMWDCDINRLDQEWHHIPYNNQPISRRRGGGRRVAPGAMRRAADCSKGSAEDFECNKLAGCKWIKQYAGAPGHLGTCVSMATYIY